MLYYNYYRRNALPDIERRGLSNRLDFFKEYYNDKVLFTTDSNECSKDFKSFLKSSGISFEYVKSDLFYKEARKKNLSTPFSFLIGEDESVFIITKSDFDYLKLMMTDDNTENHNWDVLLCWEGEK